MSLNAAALRLMREKGLSLDDVVEIAAAMEKRRDNTGAERQQRLRDKRNARDVTRDAPLNESILTPPYNPPETSNEVSPPSAENENGQIVLKPEHVVEAWNDMAARTGLPKARMTADRQRKLKPLVRRIPVDDWTEAISAVERSPFCQGQNDRGWRADFDFLLQTKSFNRLIEGSYDGASH